MGKEISYKTPQNILDEANINEVDFNDLYKESLEARLGMSYSVMRGVFNQVKGRKKKIVFPEGDHEKVIRAAAQCIEQDICVPILLGNVKSIRQKMAELNIEFDCEITNPRYDDRRIGDYDLKLLESRSRKGMTIVDAQRLLKSRPYFAAQMVEQGDADGFLGGISRNYADVLRPCLEVIGSDEDSHCAIGCYMMVVKGRLIFLGDATVNVYPDSKTLADIAVQTAKVARRFGLEPKVAMLSFSNFGSSRAQRSERIEEAIEMAAVRVVQQDYVHADGPRRPHLLSQAFARLADKDVCVEKEQKVRRRAHLVFTKPATSRQLPALGTNGAFYPRSEGRLSDVAVPRGARWVTLPREGCPVHHLNPWHGRAEGLQMSLQHIRKGRSLISKCWLLYVPAAAPTSAPEGKHNTSIINTTYAPY